MAEYNLGLLPSRTEKLVLVMLNGKEEYDKETNGLGSRVIFFYPSGRYYGEEYFAVRGTTYTAKEINTLPYSKAHNLTAIYTRTCEFLSKNDLHKDMTAVLDYPAFFPAIFKAEDRKN